VYLWLDFDLWQHFKCQGTCYIFSRKYTKFLILWWLHWPFSAIGRRNMVEIASQGEHFGLFVVLMDQLCWAVNWARVSSIPGRVMSKTWKTVLALCSASCSVLLDGCKGKLHDQCYNWIVINASFTTKVAAWRKASKIWAPVHYARHSKRNQYNASVMKLVVFFPYNLATAKSSYFIYMYSMYFGQAM